MHLGWNTVNDMEYVERVRRTSLWMHQWKWWITGLIAILFGCCVAIWTMVARIASNDLFLNPPPPFNTYSQGLGNGFLMGFFAAFVPPFLICTICFLLNELRTWRLLLAYHDRLEQAGLLPLELAETMDCSDPEQTRS